MATIKEVLKEKKKRFQVFPKKFHKTCCLEQTQKAERVLSHLMQIVTPSKKIRKGRVELGNRSGYAGSVLARSDVNLLVEGRMPTRYEIS